MGTPPACMWSTLYFSIHENKLCHKYRHFLLFYKRLIDDGFGVWNWTGTPACCDQWSEFKQEMKTFGKLQWVLTTLSTHVAIVDLTLTICNGRIETTLFEKELNLYLYLLPHSAHPTGVLKGLIAGMILRIIRLTSAPINRKAHV